MSFGWTGDLDVESGGVCRWPAAQVLPVSLLDCAGRSVRVATTLHFVTAVVADSARALLCRRNARLCCCRRTGRTARSFHIPASCGINCGRKRDAGQGHCESSQRWLVRESGETGRRAGFRILCLKRRGGSTPPSRNFLPARHARRAVFPIRPKSLACRNGRTR